MIKYNWKIEALDCIISENGLENVIQNIHWRYVGTSEKGNISDVYGVESLEFPSPDNFISTDKLTNEIIISWLEKRFSVLKEIPNEDKEAPVLYEEFSKLQMMQGDIEKQINLKENPTNIIIVL